MPAKSCLTLPSFLQVFNKRGGGKDIANVCRWMSRLTVWAGFPESFQMDPFTSSASLGRDNAGLSIAGFQSFYLQSV